MLVFQSYASLGQVFQKWTFGICRGFYRPDAITITQPTVSK